MPEGALVTSDEGDTRQLPPAVRGDVRECSPCGGVVDRTVGGGDDADMVVLARRSSDELRWVHLT